MFMRMVNIRTVVEREKVLTFGASARGLLVCLIGKVAR